MLVKSIRKQTAKRGIRNLTSATHIPVPGRPRDPWVSICPGEGIGPQLIESVLHIFDYLKVPLKTEMIDYSSLKRDKSNSRLLKNKCLLLGPVSNKTCEEESKGVCHSQILKELNTYATITSPISIPGVETNGKDIELLIINETNCGFQAETAPSAEYDDVSSVWITPQKSLTDLAKYAFESAVLGKRRKVSAFHQANFFKESHGEFLMKLRNVAGETKTIEYEELLQGEGAAKLIKDPEAFDLIVIPSNCGDVIQSIAMSLVGGEGMVPWVHLGDKHTIFQQGGTSPCYNKVNERSANPTGMILSASMMLRQVNLPIFADLLENAVFDTYKYSDARTAELGGNYSTREFTEKVIENIHTKSFQRKASRSDQAVQHI
jgi:isocitrate dehydrogenase (NAD+)